MVGLSLSFCVLDVAKGKVKEEDVEKIIAGISASTPEQWERVLDSYCKSYWIRYPDAINIARRLIEGGKVEQPRLRGEVPPNISQGHWVDLVGK